MMHVEIIDDVGIFCQTVRRVTTSSVTSEYPNIVLVHPLRYRLNRTCPYVLQPPNIIIHPQPWQHKTACTVACTVVGDTFSFHTTHRSLNSHSTALMSIKQRSPWSQHWRSSPFLATKSRDLKHTSTRTDLAIQTTLVHICSQSITVCGNVLQLQLQQCGKNIFCLPLAAWVTANTA